MHLKFIPDQYTTEIIFISVDISQLESNIEGGGALFVDHSIDASKTLLHHLMGDADIRRLTMKPSRRFRMKMSNNCR